MKSILIALLLISCDLIAGGKSQQSKSENQSATCKDHTMLGMLKPLPLKARTRVSRHLTQLDSALLLVNFLELTSEEKDEIAFDNGQIKGTIRHSGGRLYRIFDNNHRFLGVMQRSKNGKRYTLLNARGEPLCDTIGMFGLVGGIVAVGSFFIALVTYVALQQSRTM